MHDAERLAVLAFGFVGGVKAVQGLDDGRDGDAARHAFTPRLGRLGEPGQRFTAEELHHQEEFFALPCSTTSRVDATFG